MEVLAIIPARGGSKGIPHKNIVPLCGKPLIQYTLQAAAKSERIGRVIVSTDDEKIADVCRDGGAEVQYRPECLSGDTVPMKAVIDYHLKQLGEQEYHPDILILLQPTSPLRTEKHIDEALRIMMEDEEADAIVSVVWLPHQYSPLKIMQVNECGYLTFYTTGGERYTTRQELPQLYARNGAAIYAVYVDSYRKTHSLYGTKCLPYPMHVEESVDVDGTDDLELAAYYMQKRKSRTK